VRIAPVPIPHDCTDGFLHAYWRRPEAYLDARVRSGSSSFWAIGKLKEGLGRLASDLESGEWHRRPLSRLGCALSPPVDRQIGKPNRQAGSCFVG